MHARTIAARNIDSRNESLTASSSTYIDDNPWMLFRPCLCLAFLLRDTFWLLPLDLTWNGKASRCMLSIWHVSLRRSKPLRKLMLIALIMVGGWRQAMSCMSVLISVQALSYHADMTCTNEKFEAHGSMSIAVTGKQDAGWGTISVTSSKMVILWWRTATS